MRRYLKLWTGLFGLLLISSMFLLLYQPLRPDFYQPARPSLTEAKRHLASVYEDERLLLQELGDTRQQLDLTLDLLSRAKLQLSSEQQRTLQGLSRRIHQLEPARASARLTPERLHETYRQLAAELSGLIHSLE